MMENNDKRQSPYRGFWVIVLMMIGFPVLSYLIVHGVLEEFSRSSDALDLATSKALGCGIGFLFHLCLVISGVLTPGWMAVKYRLGEFFENLVVGIGYAFETYWEDMRDDGVTLLVEVTLILINLLIALSGLRDALVLLGHL